MYWSWMKSDFVALEMRLMMLVRYCGLPSGNLSGVRRGVILTLTSWSTFAGTLVDAAAFGEGGGGGLVSAANFVFAAEMAVDTASLGCGIWNGLAESKSWLK